MSLPTTSAAFSGRSSADHINDHIVLHNLANTVYNVLDYGAVGDGVTDDTEAIQAALDAAHTADGGVVLIPAQHTFICDPSIPLIVYSNTELVGQGYTSVLKVKNNAGDFTTLITQANLSTQVTSIKIRNIRFDMNPTGNTTCDIRAAVSGKEQVTLRFGQCDGITVENCWFDPCCGVNTVVFYGSNTSLDVKVINCYFKFVMARTLDDSGEYDNSAVYFESYGHIATGNRFVADISERARGAIESHYGPSVINNNHSDGFETLCNIVSQSDSSTVDTNSITVNDNTAVNALHGVMLWSITGKTLRNVTVEGNTIYVNNADRARTNYHGIGLARGTGVEGTFENIHIIGNTIQCQKENREGTGEGDSGGLMFYGYGPFKGFQVQNNIVNNSPCYGMRIQTTGLTGSFDETYHVQNCDFSNNLFIDCGNNNLATSRITIYLAGSFEQVRIHDNSILDSSSPTPYGQYGLQTALVGGSSCHWYDNYVDPKLFFSPVANSAIGVETPISFVLPNGVTTVTPSPGSNVLHEYIIDNSSSNFTITQSLGVNTQRMMFRIKNTSSGAGVTISWHSSWHMQTWTNPASGYNKTIEFMKSASSVWYEITRSGDIPN